MAGPSALDEKRGGRWCVAGVRCTSTGRGARRSLPGVGQHRTHGPPKASRDKTANDAFVDNAPVAEATDAQAPSSGAITQRDVQEAVHNNAQIFEPCDAIVYAKTVGDFAVTFTVRATVNALGKVTVVKISSNKVKDRKVLECYADAFGMLTFARPVGAGTVPIHYEFGFGRMTRE